MQHHALITDDSGVRLGEETNTPATAVWLVGVYSHDGRAIAQSSGSMPLSLARWKCSCLDIAKSVFQVARR